MPVPDFQTVMLPLLRLSDDAKEHTLAKAPELLGREFEMTAEQRRKLLG